MQSEANSRPVLLAIGGHDPSGGAGIQADIEAAAANGVHALTLITCLTEQDSGNVRALHPVAPALLQRQAALLLADSRVAAFKVGLLGSREAVQAVADLMRAHPGIPLVLDPVLAAGGGSELAGSALLQSLREQLLPRCDLITPNIPEAVRLSDLGSDAPVADCANRLLALGAGAVLVTGTHDTANPDRVTHRLYRPGVPVWTEHNPRLAGEYHGSGCTLAAAIAARLARGEPLEQAVSQGLAYSWQTLRQGFRSGRGQLTPNRLFPLESAPRNGHV